MVVLWVISYLWFICFIDNSIHISEARPAVWGLANHVSSRGLCWHSVAFSHFLWGAEIINPMTLLTHNATHGKKRRGRVTLGHPAWFLCKSIINCKYTSRMCSHTHAQQTDTHTNADFPLWSWIRGNPGMRRAHIHEYRNLGHLQHHPARHHGSLSRGTSFSNMSLYSNYPSSVCLLCVYCHKFNSTLAQIIKR